MGNDQVADPPGAIGDEPFVRGADELPARAQEGSHGEAWHKPGPAVDQTVPEPAPEG
ncbi:hypothetical protein ACFWZ2_07365 [Streptomyces sp. NPDC059002]|uniref:hypothetical protein n=1 Tax=Streptomyces sp. NPDC059002 TaxID=3346690 RepID=UPI0036C7075C